MSGQAPFGALVFTSRYGEQSDTEALGRGLAAARAAEANGFDDVWCTEHPAGPAAPGAARVAV
jgi:alkanesulfonate monooxygenase SsuD/methylene tetrahydromethanopterin reductase-like flavin-dependent oxidoreductase (luciferase family)